MPIYKYTDELQSGEQFKALDGKIYTVSEVVYCYGDTMAIHCQDENNFAKIFKAEFLTKIEMIKVGAN
jgi:hypothetical protein